MVDAAAVVAASMPMALLCVVAEDTVLAPAEEECLLAVVVASHEEDMPRAWSLVWDVVAVAHSKAMEAWAITTGGLLPKDMMPTAPNRDRGSMAGVAAITRPCPMSTRMTMTCPERNRLPQCLQATRNPEEPRLWRWMRHP